ncbi:hypothetical protein AM500_05265 [Bacillus sp. FJAT-18017]|uniref:hypothetical protein n=1 Tax=Bacillus sp. FJAT-18017 TaxID=1705566 RepID=UPI0006AE6C02|nr:hypothetical protein [Bacillus sp. FJAT-18017]ALC89259.1 hypothetical protein AM500_05265 [Bacillus sp. FJAT-18017]
MGYLTRLYFYAILVFLVFNLFNLNHLHFGWYLALYFLANSLYRFNEEWFDEMQLKQFLMLIIVTLVFVYGLVEFESITKILLLIAAFILFVIPGSLPKNPADNQHKGLRTKVYSILLTILVLFSYNY